MEKSELKTSWKQRIGIILIALVLLGSTVSVYIAIVISSKKEEDKNNEAESKIAELERQYKEKHDQLNEAGKVFSDQYFNEMLGYKSLVKSYNSTTANTEGLQTSDVVTGSGGELAEGDTNYLAYYIGWCADGSVFDSSFDNYDSPTALGVPLVGGNMIEGWNQGVIGMKRGGVREITIPGELAYGETREICGGTNSPLKFIVKTMEYDENLGKLWSEYNGLTTQIQYAMYGINL